MMDIELNNKIETRILLIRGIHVMIDRDLAELYQIETKTLNQQVKRNQERFPDAFMFRLNEHEFSELVTNCDRFNLLKHSSSLPYAFTEQGVSMLSAVLRSPTAIQVSICIMESFVKMRRYLVSNIGLFQRLEQFEIRQKNTEKQVDKILHIIDESRNLKQEQGIFFDGQIFDAYVFAADLVRSAESSIILIDNYIDETVLTILDKRHEDVEAIIYTKELNRQFSLDLKKHNEQYRPIEVRTFNKAHDRFLLIDDKVYHLGASLKDLGRKWFAFSLMKEWTGREILERMDK
ncbi:MAG: ORF6N domain-containing protein [Bacteroidales bacterium]|nr:ORF6N domain-containing protein [Bacteroidales bacterium]